MVHGLFGFALGDGVRDVRLGRLGFLDAVVLLRVFIAGVLFSFGRSANGFAI